MRLIIALLLAATLPEEPKLTEFAEKTKVTEESKCAMIVQQWGEFRLINVQAHQDGKLNAFYVRIHDRHHFEVVAVQRPTCEGPWVIVSQSMMDPHPKESGCVADEMTQCL